MPELTYFRSSSYKAYDYCQNSFFMTYILGLSENRGNIKAHQGTMCHKVMEILAGCKLAEQNGESSYYDSEIDYTFEFEALDWRKKTILTDTEIQIINSGRRNKQYFSPENQLTANECLGREFVNLLIKKSLTYYMKKYPEFNWTKGEKKKVANWAWCTLEFNNGQFDPRNQNIVSPEKFFDIELPYDWATYDFVDNFGNHQKGQLSLKGTIDLTTSPKDNTIEIVDYKYGQRKDWAKDKIKTYDMMSDDTQLMMYYYAANKLFPEYEHYYITLYFIRSGGPYTICFSPSDILRFEDRIKDRFEKIKNMQSPKMLDYKQKDFRCKICEFYKMQNFKGSGTNACRYMNRSIKNDGIDKVIENETAEGFDPNFYKAPGT